MKKIKNYLMTKNRIKIFALAIVLFWIKTMLAYYTEFSLGVVGSLQTLILWINPFATSILFLSSALYIQDEKRSGNTMLFIYFVLTLILYANILYYREFADFMTVSTIKGNLALKGGSNFSAGLFASFFVMLRLWDVVYWLDFIGLYWLIKKRNKRMATQQIKQERKPFYKRYAVASSFVGLAMLFANLMIAEFDRPQLLTRTFDRNYIVKYLGVNFYTGYDIVLTVNNNRLRARADEGDLNEIYEYANENYAAPNDKYYGVAEGRNVFHIVLESTQQFVLDYHLEDEEGNMHEVSPFLNQIYNDESTIRFNNFFHQTGQGKTSDSEVLSENSLFGLPEGSAFQMLGTNNTFHAAPKILDQELDYTTAAFHGNTGTFWNRTDTYRNLGYNYFFDSDFYDMSEGNTLDYGLKDKLFFKESTKYIEQLPQPFYAKFITLTNHFPYPLEEENASIPKANTDDETVNSYFQTVRYLDESIEEFFNWLKEVGLYENSIFVMYGDHYGNSNMRNPSLAPLLDMNPEEWDAYDNVQMQRVPMMYHIPGYTEGEEIETYGGQVDLLPTLLHLLGHKSDAYLFMGQDLLSEERSEYIPLRNGNVVSPKYHFIGSDIYDAETGENITEELTEEEFEELNEKAVAAREKLTHSDNLLSLDLLRFYKPHSLADWEPIDYQYQHQMKQLKSHPAKDTNLINQLDVETTMDIYETDAPELQNQEDNFVPEDSSPEKLSGELSIQ